jgi:putative transposase
VFIHAQNLDTGRRLGTAHLADQATPEQLDALRRARTQRARRLRADAKAAEQLRRDRFAVATIPLSSCGGVALEEGCSQGG